MEIKHYPMPRTNCGAQTRAGGKCCQPAMKNGRCRLHGGKSLSGKAHGNYQHGDRSMEAMKDRRDLISLLKDALKTLQEI